MTKFPAEHLLYGAKEGTFRSIPADCFLIEKVISGETVRVLFELGLRDSKDHKKESYKRLGPLWEATYAPGGAAGILERNGVSLASVQTIFFGHTHFDHIGNLAPFPAGTAVVVGPGSVAVNELADELDVPDHVVKMRSVRTLMHRGDIWETVGCFKGVDYFGDGSLWILDTPGHKEGHTTALVRTAANPPAYHLLGSDLAHDISLLWSPLIPRPRAGLFPLTYFVPDADPDELSSMHADLAEAYVSIAKAGRMDLEPDINVFLSHDGTIDALFPPGEFVPIDGSRSELTRLKNRSRV